MFECQYSIAADGYIWVLNGDSVDPTRTPPGVKVGPGFLSPTIPAIPVYHKSVVWCEAIVNRIFLPSKNASLEVYG